MVSAGRISPTRLTIACVSGSLAGPVPAYCPSPGAPIGPHPSGKLRLRSTPWALPRCGTARPSGFIDSTSHRSMPGGTGRVASCSRARIGRPSTERPISATCNASPSSPATPGSAVGGSVVVVVVAVVVVIVVVAAAGGVLVDVVLVVVATVVAAAVVATAVDGSTVVAAVATVTGAALGAVLGAVLPPLS